MGGLSNLYPWGVVESIPLMEAELQISRYCFLFLLIIMRVLLEGEGLKIVLFPLETTRSYNKTMYPLVTFIILPPPSLEHETSLYYIQC